MEYTSLSVEEIEQQLAELEISRAELERALEERRQELKDEVAQQVRDLVSASGFDIEEILPLLETQRRRGPGSRASVGGPRHPLSGDRRYQRFVDPENASNVYVRGVLPGWMKRQMVAKGLDPKKKSDRDAFKHRFLRAVED